VKPPLSILEWISHADGSLRLVLDPLTQNKLSSLTIQGDAISILVGPEGGFTDEEMEKAHANGVISVSLGPRILRTETAGPAAIAVLQAKTGGL